MVGLMGWGAPEQRWRKGPWTPEEDRLLTEYVSLNGEGRWSSVPRSTGLHRNGKSCRLRWVNYLRPGLKKGQITPQEEGIIIELHALWGNKWSTIARYLPGRTDNEIKNYWRTHFKTTQKQEKRKNQVLEQNKLKQQENGMTKISPNAELCNEIMAETQGKQEMVSMYPTVEDHCLPAVMSQDLAFWSDTITEDGLWGGFLWNVDDPRGRLDRASDYNKIAIQNQATAYSSGGNTITWNDGGYVF